MIVSSTEPPAIRALGRSSQFPERFGVDALFTVRGQRVGIQRKEVKDLRASVADGRLAKELAQMGALSMSLLIVEGKVQWSAEGEDLIGGRWGQQWTRRQWMGLLWSIQAKGVWVAGTSNIGETAEVMRDFEAWCRKDSHRALEIRPKPGSIWGTRLDAREWGVHLLQGIDGVGPELAGRIFDAFGGVPWTWDPSVDIQWLSKVEGIGPKKAQKIYRSLGNTDREQ